LFIGTRDNARRRTGGRCPLREALSDRAVLDVLIHLVDVAAEIVTGIAELLANVVAEVRDLVGRAFLAVGLPPGLLGGLVGFSHRLLHVGLGVFKSHVRFLPLSAGRLAAVPCDFEGTPGFVAARDPSTPRG
jgi:hypothetical protein